MWYKKSQNIIQAPPKMVEQIYTLYLQSKNSRKDIVQDVYISLEGWRYDRSVIDEARERINVKNENLIDRLPDIPSAQALKDRLLSQINSPIRGVDYVTVKIVNVNYVVETPASYQPALGIIEILISNKYTDEDYKSFIKHELQHFVQSIFSLAKFNNKSDSLLSTHMRDNSYDADSNQYNPDNDDYEMNDLEFHPWVQMAYDRLEEEMNGKSDQEKRNLFNWYTNKGKILIWKYENPEKYKKAIKILSNLL